MQWNPKAVRHLLAEYVWEHSFHWHAQQDLGARVALPIQTQEHNGEEPYAAQHVQLPDGWHLSADVWTESAQGASGKMQQGSRSDPISMVRNNCKDCAAAAAPGQLQNGHVCLRVEHH